MLQELIRGMRGRREALERDEQVIDGGALRAPESVQIGTLPEGSVVLGARRCANSPHIGIDYATPDGEHREMRVPAAGRRARLTILDEASSLRNGIWEFGADEAAMIQPPHRMDAEFRARARERVDELRRLYDFAIFGDGPVSPEAFGGLANAIGVSSTVIRDGAIHVPCRERWGGALLRAADLVIRTNSELVAELCRGLEAHGLKVHGPGVLTADMGCVLKGTAGVLARKSEFDAMQFFSLNHHDAAMTYRAHRAARFDEVPADQIDTLPFIGRLV